MRAPIAGSTALLTGASSGIGEALARRLAPRVKKLVLVARRVDRLERLMGELALANPHAEIAIEPCDLADRTALTALCDKLAQEHVTIDVLVNNAGMGDMGMFDLASWEKTEQMLELNVRALTYLTHRLVPGMVTRGRGGVLNISSSFGLAFLPGFAAYIGTKHFVTGFTESLRLDVAHAGVVVTQVCPGPVATEFEKVAGNFTGARAPWFIELSADACAKAALRGFSRRRALVIPGLGMKVMMALHALTPKVLLRLLALPMARWLRRRQERHLAEERARAEGR
ncbi:MAG: SDR family oxidoreductase [Myxococcales bacterium]|nr:SDR family oxidoreductase [Myxococcales bacterium]